MNKKQAKTLEHVQSDRFGFSSARWGGKQGRADTRGFSFFSFLKETLVSHLRCGNCERRRRPICSTALPVV